VLQWQAAAQQQQQQQQLPAVHSLVSCGVKDGLSCCLAGHFQVERLTSCWQRNIIQQAAGSQARRCPGPAQHNMTYCVSLLCVNMQTAAFIALTHKHQIDLSSCIMLKCKRLAAAAACSPLHDAVWHLPSLDCWWCQLHAQPGGALRRHLTAQRTEAGTVLWQNLI
jgi:hypothetical protein